MRLRAFGARAIMGVFVVAGAGCRSEKPSQATATAAPSATGSVAEEKAPPAVPSGCKASKDRPARLSNIVGDVQALAADKTHLYYASWDVYGGRGDLGAVQKDGGGSRSLTSLDLEPRGLALDGGDLYYTSGIRLVRLPKDGEPNPFALQFSSQRIALFGNDVYGVPGDYGPYDRVVKIPKKGGDTTELASSKRPAKDLKPNGFNAIAVDESGVYVTDSGADRVLRFPLAGGAPRTLAARQDKAFDLAIVGDDVYFSLARKGDLMVVSKAGGTAKKLATGLAESARIAADDRGVYTTRAGKTADDPLTITRVSPDGSDVQSLAVVPASNSVDGIALDGDCVYWTVRESPGKTVAYAIKR